MPRRGTKRRRLAEVDAELENPQQTGPGEGKITSSNVIDFEEIIRASNSVPSTGCGGGSELVNNVAHLNEPCNQHEYSQSSQLTSLLPANQTSLTRANGQISAIRLANDDLAAHIPTSLKLQICQGEYINLALLLKGAIEIKEFCSGSILKLSVDGQIEARQRECKEKITTIEKWTDAFVIYTSIYLTANPGKTNEMLHDMYNIRECARNQGGGILEGL